MSEFYGRMAYPLVILAVVGTTWCLAWARSVEDRANRGTWPAPDPELIRQIIRDLPPRPVPAVAPAEEDDCADDVPYADATADANTQ